MDKTGKNIIDLIFISAFVFFIALPNVHLSQAKISEKENRTLEVYKPLFSNRKINLNYGKDFEAFYSDRFFTRKWLLSLNEKLGIKVLPPPHKNAKVTIGRDDWSFYRDNNSERNFANLDYLSDKQLKDILSYLSGIKDWCDRNGKIFVYFIAPDKNKVYGEFFPQEVKKINPDTESRAIQLIDYIHANSDINVIYPLESLLHAKTDGKLLYYKNDTHWSPLGAYIGYIELCETLDIEPIKFDGFDETLHETGDLTIMFPEGVKKDVTTVYFNPKIDSKFSEQIEKGGERNGVKTDCPGKTLRAVFFHDSFITAIRRYVSNSFSHVEYNWRHSILDYDLQELQKADIIVLLQVERGIPKLANYKLPEVFK